jgi:hypothetical protein
MTGIVIDSHLAQLKFAMTMREHVYLPKQTDVMEWVKMERPCVWQIAESVNHGGKVYEAWLDSAYGYFALFKEGKLLGLSRETIVTEDAILLYREYYSAKKYLWF